MKVKKIEWLFKRVRIYIERKSIGKKRCSIFLEENSLVIVVEVKINNMRNLLCGNNYFIFCYVIF